MSSLSQEDLDAGWDDADVAAAAQPAGRDSNTIPPNSMTREKQAAPLASLVVPAGEQASTSADLPVPAALPIELAGRSLENARLDDEPHAPAPELMAGDSCDPAPPDSGSNAVRDRAQASEPEARDTCDPASPDSDSNAVRDRAQASEPEGGRADDAQPSEAQSRAPLAPAAGEVNPVEDASPSPDEAPPLHTETAVAVAIASNEAEPSAVEFAGPSSIDVAPSQVTTTETVRHPARPEESRRSSRSGVRWPIWCSAALVGIAIGYFVLQRTKPTNATRKPTLSSRTNESVRVAPPPRETINANEKATDQAGAVAAPGNTAQRPEGATAPLGVSFSDAFVKHAASVNSNWAEVKKRPRVAEPQSASRPKSGGTASGENPLGVLDELEKARKAKKASIQPQ